MIDMMRSGEDEKEDESLKCWSMKALALSDARPESYGKAQPGLHVSERLSERWCKRSQDICRKESHTWLMTGWDYRRVSGRLQEARFNKGSWCIYDSLSEELN